MFSLAAFLLASTPALPAITVVPEAGHYRLTVELFREPQGPAVNAAITRRMAETCGRKTVEPLELDFDTVDPANDLSSDPPIQRTIWNYWQTFNCVDGKDAFRP